jgi:predicted esterase
LDSYIHVNAVSPQSESLVEFNINAMFNQSDIQRADRHDLELTTQTIRAKIRRLTELAEKLQKPNETLH